MIRKNFDSGLPRLGWISYIEKTSLSVTVLHGADVELADNFIVEGVWDGDFKLGNFNCAEHFFGSGLIVQNDGVLLVPSTALVDKLFFCEDGEYFFASNSLVCLLAYLGAELDPTHNYKIQSDNIMMGIDRYDSSFPILHNKIKLFEQLFYFVVKITKNGYKRQHIDRKHEFENYSAYYDTLREKLKDIRRNSCSPDRKKSFLAYTTISRGYDSTAATALTHDLDINKAFTSRKSSSAFLPWMNPGAAVDDGTDIARQLKLKISYLDYVEKDIGDDETLFICPTPAEPEIVFYKAYQELGKNEVPSIVFTGYHGDELWNRNLSPQNLKRNIIRGGVSGINLGEARLESGFINIPIPFMYAREVSSLHSISNSDELAPWSTGDDYDRPIARRVVEDQGIPREAFGSRKKTVINFYNKPKNKLLRKQFYKFLEEEYGLGKSHCILSSNVDTLIFYSKKLLNLFAPALGIKSQPLLTIKSLDLPYKMYFWAVKYEVNKKKSSLNNIWQDNERIN
ncbi:hypothetical protein [Marinobacter maritimus]|uniref:hypothetical protein n=1 Tax=Marinobacter maritimus TaxID=277961 RepID=UPI00119DFF6C|nr:hypothetical protein [Marinobacter maritimus]